MEKRAADAERAPLTSVRELRELFRSLRMEGVPQTFRMGLEGAPEGLTPAAPEDRRFELSHVQPGVINAAVHVLDGRLYWTRWRLADLPNELIGVEDLEKIGVSTDRVDVAPVVEG